MVENLNRQRVLSLLDALYAGDIEAALARCSDDVELIARASIRKLTGVPHPCNAELHIAFEPNWIISYFK